jgi:hypothetical protein
LTALPPPNAVGACHQHDAGAARRSTARRSTSARRQVPVWREGRGQLFWGDRLVKHFRQPAANQRAILHAFQEQGWPEDGISNPLPDDPFMDRQEQFHDAIKALNQNQRGGQVLRFHGGGTGEQVWWEPVEGS